MNLEIFGCAGGMALGFKAAGIEFDLVVDKDPNACESYERNVGHRPVQMDVRELLRVIRLMPPSTSTQLLVADPPCTPWSRAGKREGLRDERDMLRETVEVIRALRPRAFLIGNVPGLDDGPNWPIVQDVIGGLTREGYCIDYARLDAADFGVPQRRIRPFWFGHPRGSQCIRWPRPTHGDPASFAHADLGEDRAPWVTCRQALQHLPVEQLGKPVRLRARGTGMHGHPVSTPDAPAPALTTSGGRGGRRATTLIDGDALMTRRLPPEPPELTPHPKHPINQPDEPSYTLAARDRGGAQGALAVAWPWDRPATTVQVDERIAPPGHHEGSFLSPLDVERPATTVTARDEIGRPGRNGRDGSSQSTSAIKLSERAAAILQGFPEFAVFAGATKRARWSQIGQAMPPPLAAAVARSIAAWLAMEAERAA